MSCPAQTLRPVPGVPDLLVSDDGYAWRLQSNGGWKRLHPSANDGRDVQLGMRGADRRWASVYMHAPRPRAFGGHPTEEHVGRHPDGNPQNDPRNNLKWVTRAEDL